MSSVPQPVSGSRPSGHAGSRSSRSRRRRPLEQPRRPDRASARDPGRATARPRPPTCGAANEVPIALGNGRPTVGVRPVGAAGTAATGSSGRREDRRPGAARSLYTRVAVRVVGDRPVLAERAHAEHVWKRRRVVGERPRRRGRLRRRSHGGDDDRAVRIRVLDSGLLERRVRVKARVERVTDTAEAEVDHPRAVVDRPADRARFGLSGRSVRRRPPSR